VQEDVIGGDLIIMEANVYILASGSARSAPHERQVQPTSSLSTMKDSSFARSLHAQFCSASSLTRSIVIEITKPGAVPEVLPTAHRVERGIVAPPCPQRWAAQDALDWMERGEQAERKQRQHQPEHQQQHLMLPMLSCR